MFWSFLLHGKHYRNQSHHDHLNKIPASEIVQSPRPPPCPPLTSTAFQKLLFHRKQPRTILTSEVTTHKSIVYLIVYSTLASLHPLFLPCCHLCSPFLWEILDIHRLSVNHVRLPRFLFPVPVPFPSISKHPEPLHDKIRCALSAAQSPGSLQPTEYTPNRGVLLAERTSLVSET